MKKVLLLGLVIILGGCATSEFGKVSSGGAIYEYSKKINTDGSQECTARATSSREAVGVRITIGDNCSFETIVDEVAGPYEIMDRILNLVPVP